MDPKIPHALKNFGFVWGISMLALLWCPYLFVTFPLYLLLIGRHVLAVYEVTDDKGNPPSTGFGGKLLWLLLNLALMIFFSYLAFAFAPSFQVFNVGK